MDTKKLKEISFLYNNSHIHRFGQMYETKRSIVELKKGLDSIKPTPTIIRFQNINFKRIL